MSLNFKRIDEENMPIVWQYLCHEKWRTCDFSYGGVLMWVDYFRYEYAVCENTLFIKGVLEDELDKPAFSLPIGQLSLADSVNILREYCAENNSCLEFSAIPEYAIADFQILTPKCIKELEHWGDYLYLADDLAFLRGKKFSKKRNHVNQFVGNYPNYVYERINRNNLSSIKLFMSEFIKGIPENSMAMSECKLTMKILESVCDENPLLGGVLFVNKKLVAFTVGDIKNDTLFIHVEKADRNVAGSYETINKMFVEDILQTNPDIVYVNREDDAGDKGLRRAKLSYNPIDVLKKFNVIF